MKKCFLSSLLFPVTQAEVVDLLEHRLRFPFTYAFAFLALEFLLFAFYRNFLLWWSCFLSFTFTAFLFPVDKLVILPKLRFFFSSSPVNPVKISSLVNLSAEGV
ncbi:hypothetical protein CEXT_401291 [Caerostris extrusa]|uniref:Uncharacterized protein n=1 Tax=Caerostris extrusa TaxID=172846 RepID=A0AAV4PD14_CAEEX|nr:hypothetical protein CEXT_401291 [Caerostris extrusa]